MFFNILFLVLEAADTASDLHDARKGVKSWMKKHAWAINFKKDGSPRFKKLR